MGSSAWSASVCNAPDQAPIASVLQVLMWLYACGYSSLHARVFTIGTTLLCMTMHRHALAFARTCGCSCGRHAANRPKATRFEEACSTWLS
eukprot:2808727-Rhodomonas_salina.1